jgi:hypothetical protein
MLCRMLLPAVLLLAGGALALRADDPGSTTSAAGTPGAVLKTRFGKVPIFPADNPWNQDISEFPVHPFSDAYIKTIGTRRPLTADFGTSLEDIPFGIPFLVVGKDQPGVPVRFDYKEESDPGPYPVPLEAPIEGGADSDGNRRVIVIDAYHRKLYEMYIAFPKEDHWQASAGAVFDLDSNELRPAGYASADAAGLPIFPGLVRYDEVVEQGEIRHALRFTVKRTQRGYISPARHFASTIRDGSFPPMGLRMRLKADYDISGFPKSAQVILKALKKYGMILADNGGDLYLSGQPHDQWRDDELQTLSRVKAADFEAVRTGDIVIR